MHLKARNLWRLMALLPIMKRDPRRRLLLLRRQLGNLGWQGGEAVSDLVCLRDLQRLADRQGLLPGCPCRQVAPNRSQGVAKIPERLGLAMAVAQLPEESEAVLMANDGLRISLLPPVDGSEVAQAVGLTVAIA
jgi:hypothetical protein